MAVTQIGFDIGFEDAAREGGLVVAAHCPDALSLFGEDERGAGILAHRQHAAGSDVGILQHIQSHELVIRRGFGIVHNRAELPQMGWAQQMRCVTESFGSKQRQCLGRNGQNFLTRKFAGPDVIGGEAAIRDLLRSKREHFLKLEFGHLHSPG